MIRILHVVYSLNHGGVENWLINLLQNIVTAKYHMDFVLHDPSGSHFEAKAGSLGAGIFRICSPSNGFSYSCQLRRILKAHGPYDVVHSHDMTWSGLVMFVSAMNRIPVRIFHLHHTFDYGRYQSCIKRFYIKLTMPLVNRYSTHLLAVSSKAYKSLPAKVFDCSKKWQLLPCAIDCSEYDACPDGSLLKQHFGIDNDSIVIGHVGSFRFEKNHKHIIEVFSKIRELDDLGRYRLVLIGDGPLRKVVEREISIRGLSELVVLTGRRDDVPQWLLSVFDLFFFPSISEGLGISVVEAQAAGLPCVISDAIPEEVEVTSDLVFRLPLTASIEAWAHKIMMLANRAAIKKNHSYSLKQVQNSIFNFDKNRMALNQLYCQK